MSYLYLKIQHQISQKVTHKSRLLRVLSKLELCNTDTKKITLKLLQQFKFKLYNFIQLCMGCNVI